MVIQITFLTICETPRCGLATHVHDPARATMPTSLTLNSFLSLPPCERWTLPKRFSGLHKGSFWNQGDWSIMHVPVIHHVLPKSTLFSLQDEGDTVSKGKTNTGPLSGRWNISSSSFYIFLATATAIEVPRNLLINLILKILRKYGADGRPNPCLILCQGKGNRI